jgi:glycine cleavage system H lipoate-binding protein
MVAILVISMILFFLMVDAFRLYLKGKSLEVKDIVSLKPFASLETPLGIFFDTSHTYARLNDDGEMKVGVDELILKAIKEISKIEFLPRGTQVNKGDIIGYIESGGKRLKIHSPISGTIISFNQNALNNPSALFEDPYFGSWLVKMHPTEIKEGIKDLLIGTSAKNFLEKEYSRFIDFLSKSATPALKSALADGAKPVMGAVQFLDERGWKEFEDSFMTPRKN